MEWSELSNGHRLRIVCDLKGWTLEELGRKANISRFTISHTVSGRQPGGLWFWRAVADALGVRLGWLLEGEGEVWRARGVETPKTAEAPIAPAVRAPALPMSPAKKLPAHQRKRR